jgi:pyruvate,water dikinase
MFSIDTESGFEDVVFITSSYGLGETVVQGAVNPDEFYVYKNTLANAKRSILKKNCGSKMIKMVYAQEDSPEKAIQTVAVDEAERGLFSIDDSEITELAKIAVTIEQHYARPMDIEWAKDGENGKLYIVQARPETVQSRAGRVIERYQLKQQSDVLVSGRAVGNRIGRGTVKVISDLSQMDQIEQGDVLVTDMTDPDWEPIRKRAAAIVTNRGGRTCHAAIIARELGIPALVGTGSCTEDVAHLSEVTVSCAEGDTGFIYDGILDFEEQQIELDSVPDIPVKIMMNVGNPDRAFAFAASSSYSVGCWTELFP